jgi:uncharacterized repeat protein (TIGR03833 family)
VSNLKIPSRKEIRIGQRVWAIEKRNYASGELTEGIVVRILTSKTHHPRGIKVVLKDGTVARVQRLTPPKAAEGRTLSHDLDMEGELR